MALRTTETPDDALKYLGTRIHRSKCLHIINIFIYTFSDILDRVLLIYSGIHSLCGFHRHQWEPRFSNNNHHCLSAYYPNYCPILVANYPISLNKSLNFCWLISQNYPGIKVCRTGYHSRTGICFCSASVRGRRLFEEIRYAFLRENLSPLYPCMEWRYVSDWPV